MNSDIEHSIIENLPKQMHINVDELEKIRSILKCFDYIGSQIGNDIRYNFYTLSKIDPCMGILDIESERFCVGTETCNRFFQKALAVAPIYEIYQDPQSDEVRIEITWNSLYQYDDGIVGYVPPDRIELFNRIAEGTVETGGQDNTIQFPGVR